MPRVDPARRADMVRFLELGWRPGAIAKHLHVSEATVYNTEQNLMRYGLPLKPRVRKTGRPAALTKADRVALLELLLDEGWKYLDELQYWLYHERSVEVSLNTISRVLKKEGWSRKAIKRIA